MDRIHTNTHTKQAQSHAELLLVMCHCLPVLHTTSSTLQSHVHSHLISFLLARTHSSTSTFTTQCIPQHITGRHQEVRSVASVETNQENSQSDSETLCFSCLAHCACPLLLPVGGWETSEIKRNAARAALFAVALHQLFGDAERSTSTFPFKLSKITSL